MSTKKSPEDLRLYKFVNQDKKNSKHAHLLFEIFKNHINIPRIKPGSRSFRAT